MRQDVAVILIDMGFTTGISRVGVDFIAEQHAQGTDAVVTWLNPDVPMPSEKEIDLAAPVVEAALKQERVRAAVSHAQVDALTEAVMATPDAPADAIIKTAIDAMKATKIAEEKK